MELHVFYGTDQYKNRKAHVFIEEDGSYTVTMISDSAIIEDRNIKGHSEQYAEDCAENWVLGII
jgi:hypothetical protein